jgi:hypothetical protein
MVQHVKLLGILLSDNLAFGNHVNVVLSLCGQRFYLLKLHRDCGMSTRNLNVVYCALVINCILYCLSVWEGFQNFE